MTVEVSTPTYTLASASKHSSTHHLLGPVVMMLACERMLLLTNDPTSLVHHHCVSSVVAMRVLKQVRMVEASRRVIRAYRIDL
jgi:hypothetical protein